MHICWLKSRCLNQCWPLLEYFVWIIPSKLWMITTEIPIMFTNICSNWHLPWNTADVLGRPGADTMLPASDQFLPGFGTLCCVSGNYRSAKIFSFQPHWILGSALRAHHTCIISTLSVFNNGYILCATINLDHGSVGWIGSNWVNWHFLNQNEHLYVYSPCITVSEAWMRTV